MKRQLAIPFLLVVPFSSYFLIGSLLGPSKASGDTVTVMRGPLTVWSTYEGGL